MTNSAPGIKPRFEVVVYSDRHLGQKSVFASDDRSAADLAFEAMKTWHKARKGAFVAIIDHGDGRFRGEPCK